MTYEMVKQTRRRIRIFFILFFVLLFILGFAGNLFELRSPIEDYWQLWCHNWAELAGGVLFGSGFLVVGLAFIFFPKKLEQTLYVSEKDSNDLNIWCFIAGGLIMGIPIIWAGIDILSNMLGSWVTECYP